uniref:Plastid lipid-associated protein/fibrillin conserved domain-containing protein n=1 Tax=Trieres chinensis TaxID=1514140 RepID=A0A7S2EC39_TRICV|mmetsp:Transcript_17053/g.34992  ORF Transcript_17053/g.34992 Transcript_17053/m.34992 type:complete len:334 (+) Transcript_17053:47-1048(+)
MAVATTATPRRGAAAAALLLVSVAFQPFALAFAPATPPQAPHRRASPHGVRPFPSSSSALFASFSSSSAEVRDSLKSSLLTLVRKLRDAKERDGDFSVDFGVKGGELNETTRTPQKVNYYSISKEVGETADEILSLCEELADVNPTEVPTAYLGDKERGDEAPLNGAWKLLFTTAADASFSGNSTRGDARVQNVVDASRGRITNVIEFLPPPDDGEGDGEKKKKGPPLKSLNVVIKATAAGDSRVDLKFRYAKVVLNRFPWRLYIPVPGPFITRIIVLLSRLAKFGRGGAKKVPKAYFDILYLDDDLRIHKTGDDNLFVQAKEGWEDARPLLK